MLRTGELCPICGHGQLSEQVITENFQYKGRKFSIPNYCIFSCDSCAEKIVSNQTLRETEKILTDFRRTIDGFLTSKEIKAIRKKFGKTQIEMADMLDVGKKTFARYENGQVTQSKAMDLFLRMLDDSPHSFFRIKTKKRIQMDYTVLDEPSIECPKSDKASEYIQKTTDEYKSNTEAQYAAAA